VDVERGVSLQGLLCADDEVYLVGRRQHTLAERRQHQESGNGRRQESAPSSDHGERAGR